jgi:hypothetical protein
LIWVPFPPERPIDWLVGAIVYAQGGSWGAAGVGVGVGEGLGEGVGVGVGPGWIPDCDTPSSWPPTSTEPLRADPVFGWMLIAILPLLVPLLPEVTVIHEAVLDACQEQPFVAVSANVVLPPPDGIWTLDGFRSNLHGEAA